MTDAVFTSASLFARARDVAKDIEIRRPGYHLAVGQDDTGIYFQIYCQRPDTYTEAMGEGQGGKRYLAYHTTPDEMVRIAFSILDAYDHHEDREAFLYKGKRVFGPHITIDALMSVADQVD